MEEAKNLKTVVISDSDMDVARLQGRDIEELKKERLRLERHRKISEIKKKYGIKEEEKEIELPEGIPEIPKVVNERQKLWDILDGKGLINKP